MCKGRNNKNNNFYILFFCCFPFYPHRLKTLYRFNLTVKKKYNNKKKKERNPHNGQWLKGMRKGNKVKENNTEKEVNFPFKNSLF